MREEREAGLLLLPCSGYVACVCVCVCVCCTCMRGQASFDMFAWPRISLLKLF